MEGEWFAGGDGLVKGDGLGEGEWFGSGRKKKLKMETDMYLRINGNDQQSVESYSCPSCKITP